MNSNRDSLLDNLRESLKNSVEVPSEELWTKIVDQLQKRSRHKKLILSFCAILFFLLPLFFVSTERSTNHRSFIISANKSALLKTTTKKKFSLLTSSNSGTISRNCILIKENEFNPRSICFQNQPHEIALTEKISTPIDENIKTTNALLSTSSNVSCKSEYFDTLLLPKRTSTYLSRLPLFRLKTCCFRSKKENTCQNKAVRRPWEISFVSQICNTNSSKSSLEKNNSIASQIFSWTNFNGIGISYAVNPKIRVHSGFGFAQQQLNYYVHQKNVLYDTVSMRFNIITPFIAFELYKSNLVNNVTGEDEEEMEVNVQDTIIPKLEFTNSNKMSFYYLPITCSYRIPVHRNYWYVNAGLTFTDLRNGYTEVVINGFTSPKYNQTSSLNKLGVLANLESGFILNFKAISFQAGMEYKGSLISLTKSKSTFLNTHSFGLSLGLYLNL